MQLMLFLLRLRNTGYKIYKICLLIKLSLDILIRITLNINESGGNGKNVVGREKKGLVCGRVKEKGRIVRPMRVYPILFYRIISYGKGGSTVDRNGYLKG
jgi:hypothetical protein